MVQLHEIILHCPQDPLKVQPGCGLQQGWIRGENYEGGSVAEHWWPPPGMSWSAGRQQR